MKKINELKQEIEIKIRANSILVFDMDGTLVDTNFANYLSYIKAIKSIIPTATDIPYNPNERFNRASLKEAFTNLTETEYEDIIQQKEESYYEHLPQTKLNKLLVDILIQYFNTNQTILVTNCRESRALTTLNFHNLTGKFSNIFYRSISDNGERTNKYKNAIASLDLPTQTIVAFENEKAEIDDAILAGISISNIISL